MPRKLAIVCLVVALALAAGCLTQQDPGATIDGDADCTVDDPRADDPAMVTLHDGSEAVATIDAAVADDGGEQYIGLGNYDCLPEDEGMVFVYEQPRDRTFVMREMDFGIDIVYVDAAGCVTSVHAADAPGPGEDGEDQEYPGHGQYVIEVVQGVASDAGVDRNDPVRIEHDEYAVDGTDADCFDS